MPAGLETLRVKTCCNQVEVGHEYLVVMVVKLVAIHLHCESRSHLFPELTNNPISGMSPQKLVNRAYSQEGMDRIAAYVALGKPLAFQPQSFPAVKVIFIQLLDLL